MFNMNSNFARVIFLLGSLKKFTFLINQLTFITYFEEKFCFPSSEVSLKKKKVIKV